MSIVIRSLQAALVWSLISMGAAADEGTKKVWACSAQGTQDEDLFLVSWGSNSYVKLYDARIWGQHYADGEDLRWDFGDGPGGYAAFSAVLKPDGELDYYDFRNAEGGEAIAPSFYYSCRLAQS